MSYDPFGDDPDADIFRDDEDVEENLGATPAHDPDLDSRGNGHKHSIDGSECPTCNVVHPRPFGDDLDPQAEDAMLGLFDVMPDELVREILNSDGKGNNRPQAEMLTSFLDFTERMDRANALGPVLRAIVEHLDEETGGKITAKWRIYDAERRLVITHKIFKSTNTALDDGQTNEANKNYLSMLELLMDFAKERLAMLTEQYTKACEALNEEPHQSIIEYGKYPDNEPRSEPELIMNELYRELMAH